jgi:hypothetical protein
MSVRRFVQCRTQSVAVSLKSAAVLLIALFMLTGCGGGGGGSSTTPGTPQSAQIQQGTWEVVAHSQNVAGNGLLIEANLTQTGSQITAQANGLSLIGFINTAAQHEFFYGGNCPLSGAGQNDITGSVSGSTITVSFHENGNAFSGTGTISPDGKTITGTYQGTTCADSGTFTATLQAPLGGTHSGTLLFPGATPGTVLTDSVTATISTAADLTVNITGTVTGAHNGTFSLSGHQIGNTVNASGTFAGTPITFLIVLDSQGVLGPQKSLVVNENDSIFFFCGVLP